MVDMSILIEFSKLLWKQNKEHIKNVYKNIFISHCPEVHCTEVNSLKLLSYTIESTKKSFINYKGFFCELLDRENLNELTSTLTITTCEFGKTLPLRSLLYLGITFNG